VTAPPAAGLRGARPPDRVREVVVAGLRLAVYEWGEGDSPPVVLAHGGGDFARSFDVFAPLLVEGGYRVVSWDQRGHGDSGAATFYSWEADAFDACAVIDDLDAGRVPAIGHSKGGMVLTMVADARPDLISHLVSLDGFPTHHLDPVPALEARMTERRGWLDHRRRGVRQRSGAPAEQLAERRRRHSRRVSTEWMRYLVEVGTETCQDGRRWKGDTALRQALSNPYDLTVPLHGMPGLAIPVLAVLGLHLEVPAMGTTVDFARRFLPPHAELVALHDSGHLVHVEHPERTAATVLDFLRRH
jgi:pimeloyl-ACP methyl ester carboxylesterase